LVDVTKKGINHNCCHTAQGAKVSTATVDASVIYVITVALIVTMLDLDPKGDDATTNGLNHICCHTAQGAKASTMLMPV
jgi:hypothetical protein